VSAQRYTSKTWDALVGEDLDLRAAEVYERGSGATAFLPALHAALATVAPDIAAQAYERGRADGAAEERDRGASARCRYHDPIGNKLGFEPRGLPRCDSCKQPYRVSTALDAIDRYTRGGVQADPAEAASTPHPFEPSYSGMVCERMVMRGGGGDQCGLPSGAAIHRPPDARTTHATHAD
jgi:hypothetical protein